MRTDASALDRKRWTSLPQADLEFLAGELIGERVKVELSSGKGFQGLEGKIVDETRNTFVLGTLEGRKTVPKKECVFFFPGSGVSADGKMLVSRPEDRTRKLVRLGSRSG